MYKTNFLSKSRVCNSNNNNVIRVVWLLCTCLVHSFTMVQVSNHYLENCRSCRDTNSTIVTDGHTYICMTDGKTICPPSLRCGGIKTTDKEILMESSQRIQILKDQKPRLVQKDLILLLLFFFFFFFFFFFAYYRPHSPHTHITDQISTKCTAYHLNVLQTCNISFFILTPRAWGGSSHVTITKY